MQLSRRGLVTGLASLVVAPAIVRVDSIMRVKPVVWEPRVARIFVQALGDPASWTEISPQEANDIFVNLVRPMKVEFSLDRNPPTQVQLDDIKCFHIENGKFQEI